MTPPPMMTMDLYRWSQPSFPAALNFCRKKISHIRIDTHHDNKPMQHVVEKAGFARTGSIYVDDGSPRIAYELI